MSHRFSAILVFCFAVFCVTALFPTALYGWGGEGHQVVALIAERHLTAEARQQVHDLLDNADISDAEIASWADQIKRSRRRTGPWHYVNIPLEAAEGYDAKRDDPDGDHVVARIESFEKLLADKTKPKEARAEALKFLVHLIGDVHQPLHVAQRDGDRGGNGCRVTFLDQPLETNLHRVWDTDLLRQYIGKQHIADYADALDQGVTDEQRVAWRKGSAADWANEAWRMAQERAYKDVSAVGVTKIDEAYVKDRQTAVEQQLQRAGVRLAEVLNRALVSAD